MGIRTLGLAFFLGMQLLSAADWRCITIGKGVVYFFDLDSVTHTANGNKMAWVKIVPADILIGKINQDLKDPQGKLAKRVDAKASEQYMPLELQLKTVKKELQGQDSATAVKFWMTLVEMELVVSDFSKGITILQWEMGIPTRTYRVLNFYEYDKDGVAKKVEGTPLPWTAVVPDSPISDLMEEFGILGVG